MRRNCSTLTVLAALVIQATVAISPHEEARGDIAVCGPSINWLFVLTRHVRVPVHERTVGVIAPCPDMQFKQSR